MKRNLTVASSHAVESEFLNEQRALMGKHDLTSLGYLAPHSNDVQPQEFTDVEASNKEQDYIQLYQLRICEN